ncbi:MAG: ATP phosphoribosyltransferase regulatory subunit [Alphaproteobacteria bacterium]|nr:ATP phosphoribosyltransferase regulatory subunit [Alphaproteobacteria bacterium]
MAPVAHPALLPAGFADLLPPRAAQEASLTHSIRQLFQRHGYAPIIPPLLEFEDNLLAGAGTSLAPHTFRLMDPLSGQMLALRADMTVQVARIATTRIADWPRPLRLAYAGQVVRQSSSDHQPERQSGQIGLELIGSASPAADAEIITLACASLTAIGINNFTLDLSLPTLVTGLCQTHGLNADAAAALRHALDRKDQAAVAALGGVVATAALALLRASGFISTALPALQALPLPAALAAECEHLAAVWQILQGQGFAVPTMLDLVEYRGFEYHSGLGYTLFAHQPGVELGRGGRYHSKARGSVEPGEPATGFTFYSENLRAAMPEPVEERKLYLPFGTSPAQAERYRQQGFVTIAALSLDTDAKAEARRLGCTHLLIGQQLATLGTTE